MGQEEILLKKENGVGTIMLNRPERKNAFTMTMIDTWAETLAAWRTDADVKVIVVTGAGDAFCSGVDFTASAAEQREDGPYERKSALWDRIHRIALTLEDIDKPVIAALPGVAVGAGLDMALMCDIRFAADTARLSEGYVRVGLVPGDGGAYYLPRLVGVSKALELLWTGDFIDAQEAFRIGMVNRVYPADQLMEETYKFAQKLADGPGTVIRTIKRATYQSSRTDLRTALDLISSHMGVIRYTKDSQEAMQAATQRFRKKAEE
ncbi:MAG: enoyl-CoA hydratase/isomerase family protein [Deltaproteobacteria bacterium]|nr:enoyl-CoA hydratase/isomerase family protein [Deltaproteobacteria bacterium]